MGLISCCFLKESSDFETSDESSNLLASRDTVDDSENGEHEWITSSYTSYAYGTQSETDAATLTVTNNEEDACHSTTDGEVNDATLVHFRLRNDSITKHQLWVTVWQAFGGPCVQKAFKKDVKCYKRICLGEAVIPLTYTMIQYRENIPFALNEIKILPKFDFDFDDSVAIATGMICVKLKFVAKQCSENSMSFDNAKLNRNNNIELFRHCLSSHTLGSLEIRLVYARDIPLRASGKAPKAYCKCCLINIRGNGPPSDPLRQQTSIENSTCHPRWNHTITYRNFTLEQLEDCCLEITVWDHQSKSKRRFLGGVQLSSQPPHASISSNAVSSLIDSDESEYQLWQQLMKGKYRLWNESILKLRYFTPIGCSRSDDSFSSTITDCFE
ncbi:bitesize-like isoform [Leptotrombidium deliense]|uniref:Bitesize-like isoform n=1 Tax=Leptotrombidium deliense TaxID=299467 RepID=A0A443S9N8_9ACAR|nr:bitesize-like isoform [Leptotrombidium deliense]